MSELEEFEFRRRAEMERQMAHTTSSGSEPERQPSSFSDFIGGVGNSLARIPLGLTQRAMELTGNPKAGFIAQQERNRRAQTELDALTKGRQSFARSGGEFLGETALPLGLSALTGPTIGGATVAGMLSGYLRPSTSGEETASNALLEGLFAGGTSAATRAVLPRPKIEPEHMNSLLAGKKSGLDFTGGQIADNPIVQRAEAHSMWNPFTKWHLQPFVNRQDDAFVRRLMLDVGVPEAQIPKNPALDASALTAARTELGKRFETIFPEKETIDLSIGTQRNLWKTMSKASLKPMLEQERAIVKDAVAEVKSLAGQGAVPSKVVQDMLELLSETKKGLSTNGKDKAAAAIDDVYNELLKTIKDPAAYKAVQADYARLKTVEDLLRRSKGLGEGIPDKTKLASAIERNMPGGVMYDRSSMAGLARGGQQSAMTTALPDRSTGLPIPSDLPNLLTYWRYNNPGAKWGMMNPQSRDVAETLLRYLPGTGLRSETEPMFLAE